MAEDAAASVPACIDIYALDESKYLILKDGRCVKIGSLQDKLPDPESWPKLHERLQDGDHYIAHIRPKSSSYLSKRSDETRVKFLIIYHKHNVKQITGHDRLESVEDKRYIFKRKLNDRYQGGDFYFSKGSEFYVVFKESNTFLRTSSLFKKPAVQVQHHQLHEDLCNGLYYFATAQLIYVVTAADNDLVYHRTLDLQSIEEEEPEINTFTIDQSIAEVLRNGVQLKGIP